MKIVKSSIKQLKFGCLQFLLKRNNKKVQEKKRLHNIHNSTSLDIVKWAAFRTID